MAFYLTGYNSVDVATLCGFVTPGQTGVHDPPERELDIQYLPGNDVPQVTVLRKRERRINFSVSMSAANHAALVANLASLRGYLMPDDNFHALTVADRANQQIMALCEKWPVPFELLPGQLRAIEFSIPFLCYPYWEDASEQSAYIAGTFLTFRQATFEHSAVDGWVAGGTGGTLTVEASDPYEGARCMKVVPVGAGGGCGTSLITGITAGNKYSMQCRLKGAVGGESVTLSIGWYTAGDVFLSLSSASASVLTDDWSLCKLENVTAPATAAKAVLLVLGAAPITFCIDNVCLEEAAACGDFITPYDANTAVYNGGQTVCYPVYTCELLADMASGLSFSVGSETFTYTGALSTGDSLVIDTDPAERSVKLNGADDLANTDVDAKFPGLAVGSNTVMLSDYTKFHLTVAYRRRYL